MKNFKEYGLFGTDVEYAANWENIINICTEYKVRNVLNVGLGDITGSDARRWNYFLQKECPTISSIINLEIQKEWCEAASASKDSLINQTLCGDVRTFSTEGLEVDLVYWSHGPEHILRSEWEATFLKLEELSNSLVILQMPWGSGYDYDPNHVSKSIQKGEIEFYGYACYYQGSVDTRHASLVGIKKIQ